MANPYAALMTYETGHHLARARTVGITSIRGALQYFEECGHPEMRRQPDGAFHCPACGSEELPLSSPPVDWKAGEHTEAYWCGWIDGRFGERDSFADNPNLARWEDPSDRLDYYRGHRVGSEARREKSGRAPKRRKGPTAFPLRRCKVM
jgi:hypothetical protein